MNAPPAGGLGSPLLALRRILLFAIFTLALLPVQAVLVWLGSRKARDFPYWYHRQVCRLLGIEVLRRGQQSQEEPTLYVCNHVSYLDIPILGRCIRGSFIAKAEIAHWPFFSWLAKLQRSVFVERRSSRTRDHRDQIIRRLEQDDNLILFPEGTSGDGNSVLPFKSALLSVAERRPHDQPLTVQPVSITYSHLDGLPLGRFLRPYFAWFGDMDLPDHAWRALGLGRLTVIVEFHEPVTVQSFGSRKALAQHCQAAVEAGLMRALSGREPEDEAEKKPDEGEDETEEAREDASEDDGGVVAR